MKDEVNYVSRETRNIKSLVKQVEGPKDAKVMSCKQLADKYSYVIPLPTVEEFQRFDRELGDPKSDLRDDVVSFVTKNVPYNYDIVTSVHMKIQTFQSAVLPSGLDGGLAMSKCIVKMLKMFITKDVAVQYTAVKQAKGKQIMRITNLFSCVEGIHHY